METEASGTAYVPLSPEEIKDLRKKLTMSQRELASVFGRHTMTVSGWERGKSPPIEHHDYFLRVIRAAYEKDNLIGARMKLNMGSNMLLVWKTFIDIALSNSDFDGGSGI